MSSASGSSASTACTCCRARTPKSPAAADVQYGTACMYMFDQAVQQSSLGPKGACNQSLDAGTMPRRPAKRIKAKVIWEWLAWVLIADYLVCALCSR